MYDTDDRSPARLLRSLPLYSSHAPPLSFSTLRRRRCCLLHLLAQQLIPLEALLGVLAVWYRRRAAVFCRVNRERVWGRKFGRLTGLVES